MNIYPPCTPPPRQSLRRPLNIDDLDDLQAQREARNWIDALEEDEFDSPTHHTELQYLRRFLDSPQRRAYYQRKTPLKQRKLKDIRPRSNVQVNKKFDQYFANMKKITPPYFSRYAYNELNKDTSYKTSVIRRMDFVRKYLNFDMASEFIKLYQRILTPEHTKIFRASMELEGVRFANKSDLWKKIPDTLDEKLLYIRDLILMTPRLPMDTLKRCVVNANHGEKAKHTITPRTLAKAVEAKAAAERAEIEKAQAAEAQRILKAQYAEIRRLEEEAQREARREARREAERKAQAEALAEAKRVAEEEERADIARAQAEEVERMIEAERAENRRLQRVAENKRKMEAQRKADDEALAETKRVAEENRAVEEKAKVEAARAKAQDRINIQKAKSKAAKAKAAAEAEAQAATSPTPRTRAAPMKKAIERVNLKAKDKRREQAIADKLAQDEFAKKEAKKTELKKTTADALARSSIKKSPKASPKMSFKASAKGKTQPKAVRK
jgi:hypothetical protein